MTYCVGIEVDEGLVFAADTRTSASFDDVRVYRKMHVFEWPGERVFVIMSSGNLATTQLTVSRLQRDIDAPGAERSLRTFTHLYEVAEYVGEILVASQAKVGEDAQMQGVNVQSTLILGGQIAGERPGLYMIYPLGNCIATSPETPYLQIGESKYGKPILDRRMRLEADTPLYAEIHATWSRKLEAAMHSLPRFPWEPPRDDAEPASTAPPLPPRRAPARQDPGDAQGQQ